MLGEGDFSYGFGVFDFSYEEVKWVVVGIKVFFTPYLTMHVEFLYLNNEYII